MIYYFTGKPRNGKTLFALDYIEKKRIAENRTVYYHHIDELTLDWQHLEKPYDWNSLPDGAMIVFDEAHRYFPKRSNGSKVPQYVLDMDQHGHKGFDIFIITQDPKDMDDFITVRGQYHFHVMRKFGAESAVIHKWETTVYKSVNDNRKGSIRSDYKYNKALYGAYKSSEVHTVKRSIPFKYMMIYIMPVVVIALGGFAYWGLDKASHTQIHAEGVDQKEITASMDRQNSQNGQIRKSDQPMTTGEYLVAQTPRIEGLQYTSPRYDELTKPDSVPVPAACLMTKKRCQCFTQQATKLVVPDSMCKQIAENGFYIDFDPNPNVDKNKPVQVSSTGVSGDLSPDVDQTPYKLSNDVPSRASPNNS